MPLIEDQTFGRAVRNVARWGDTDIFPFPIENHVFYDSPDAAVSLLRDMSADVQGNLARNPPVNYSALAPVGYNGFRWATQIDPLWNAYFLAVVLSLADDIESARIPEADETVFSYRYRPEDDESLFDREGWSRFQARCRTLAQSHEYVVSVDIADFYGRIYHHRIDNELRYVDPDGGRAGQIMSILTAFSNGASYGLPVGGPAARILAELLLNAVDKLLLAQQSNLKFTRYADDYRFFVNDQESAYRAIGFLSEKLHRNEGLSLQRSKTRIMTAKEYLSALDPRDPRPGSAAKFLSLHLYYDPYSSTADQDYERLKEQLSEFDVLGLLRAELFKGRVDAALTRRLVSALQHLPLEVQEQAIVSLLDNLETLAPVIPHVMRAVKDNLPSLRDAAQDEVHARIRELIGSRHHLAQVDVNLAYMVRVLGTRRSRENEQLLAQLFATPHGYAQASAPNVQRDILLILANWQVNYWLHDRKSYYTTMHPWSQRAFYIASYSLGDEGRHWRRAVRHSLTPFQKVVADWAAGKAQSGWTIPI